jgi:hypothetical protein
MFLSLVIMQAKNTGKKPSCCLCCYISTIIMCRNTTEIKFCTWRMVPIIVRIRVTCRVINWNLIRSEEWTLWISSCNPLVNNNYSFPWCYLLLLFGHVYLNRYWLKGTEYLKLLVILWQRTKLAVTSILL